MAEGDAIVLNSFKNQLGRKSIDLVNDTFKVALYSVALASPDGADVAYSATNEIAATNYVAGGQALSGGSLAQDDTNNWAKWDATDPSWASLGAATILEARLYDDTTVTKYVMILWEIATNSNGGNYTLTLGANGILTIQ